MTEIPFYKIIKDHTRQTILTLLSERQSMSYTDMLTELNVSTGKLNYHLRVLSPFLEKIDGQYSLNETGTNACNMLTKFGDLNEQKKRSNLFKALAWLLITASVILLFMPMVLLIIAAILIAIIAVFFLYYSEDHEAGSSLFLLALVLSTVVGAIGALPFLAVHYHYTLTLGYSLHSVPFLVEALIIFPTFLGWSLTNGKRWKIAVAATISIPVIIAVVIIIAVLASPPTANSFIAFRLPLPAIFLAIPAISRIVASKAL